MDQLVPNRLSFQRVKNLLGLSQDVYGLNTPPKTLQDRSGTFSNTRLERSIYTCHFKRLVST